MFVTADLIRSLHCKWFNNNFLVMARYFGYILQ
jgi:hypothetical protein